MKIITLKIADDVYADVKDLAGIRDMMGNAYGIVDEFVGVLIGAIERGETEVDLRRKSSEPEPKKKGKKK